MERTSIVVGETPVIVVAPHGPDDTNTDLIAETIAQEFGAYAVINRGWRRSESVDYWRDFANCNDVEHLHSDVVKEEFLDPILRFVAQIKRKYDENAFVLILHGCSNSIRNIAEDQGLDMIVGYGDGNPPSYTCQTRIKNAFVYHLQKEKFGVYEGKSRGKYSGRMRNNLNQLFCQWYPEHEVNSLQLEIVNQLRTERMIDMTVSGLISALDSLMLFDDTTNLILNEVKKI